MSKMVIGFDAKRLFNNLTGLGTHSRVVVSTLKTFFPEISIQLYSPKAKKNTETLPFFNQEKYSIYDYSGRFKSYWRSFGITSQLENNNIDLFHGMSNELPFNIHRTKIKTVVTIHDLIFKSYPHTFPFFDRVGYNIKSAYACKNSTRIIAVSQNTKNDIIHYYGIDPQKIDVIYPIIHSSFQEKETNNEDKKIVKQYHIPNDFLLSLGTVEKRKNIKLIFQAYKYLPKSLRIPIVIIGKWTKYKNEIDQYLKENLPDYPIYWLNYVENTEHLSAFYRAAKLFVYPSLYEGFGAPIVESLLCKTPVITSKTSSLPEAGGNHSIFINPLYPQDLAQGIEKVLTDNEVQKRMINEGYRYAKNQFSSEVNISKLYNTYKKALHSE